MILHPDGRLEGTPEEMARYQQSRSQQVQWSTPQWPTYDPGWNTGYPWWIHQPTTISDGVAWPASDWVVVHSPNTGGDYAQLVPSNVSGGVLDVRI